MLIRTAIIITGIVCIALSPFSRALGWHGTEAGDVSAMLIVGGSIAVLLGVALLLDELVRS